MDYSLILKNISKHIQLDAPEEKYFTSLLKEKKIKRKQFILHENEICINSIFVTKGCLRGYNIDQNGFEHILQFAPPDWWIADMYSLITRTFYCCRGKTRKNYLLMFQSSSVFFGCSRRNL
jgi:hypothetical protein